MSHSKPQRVKLAGEGVGARLRYFCGRAILNVRQNPLGNALTIATIALALLLFSVFLLVYVNLEGLADSWSEKVQVTVYFDNELSAQDLASVKAKVAALPGTKNIEYVTKAEAIKRFRERLKGQEALLEGVPADILPSSLEVTLRKGYRGDTSVEQYVRSLKKIPGINEVQYGEEWVKRFTAFRTFMRLVGLLLGGFLLLAVVFIVSNTIKLTIYARREELVIMELVGATRLFIKAPFLIEGIIQGAAGSLIAVLFLFGGYLAFLHNAGNFLSFDPKATGLIFLPPEQVAAIVAGGIFVGFFGSLVSSRRFINS